MGSYAQCWLDELFVGSSKNDDIDTELISLFRSNDKFIRTSLEDDSSAHLRHYSDSLAEDPDLKMVYYESPVSIVRDRLDVLGYDLQTAKSSFSLWIEEQQIWTMEMFEKSSESMTEHYKKELQVLSGLTPDVWIASIKQIHDLGLETNYTGPYENPHENSTIAYMLSHDWYGYPGYDILVPLRLAIEAFENSKKLIYDLTELVWGDYFEYDDDFVEYGLNISALEYNSKSKTIVLTEGKSDASALGELLSHLYPHLQDYYSFLDFDSTGYGGGVGNLANVVKAFSGSGIINNVIALFDNDTAAQSACKNLEKLNLPDNIAIIRLPEIKLLECYPTLGPSGSANLNVNGMAASLELYFGEDVLRIDGKNMSPIQWTGYDKSVKRYQGEVLEKSILHTRFKDKLAKAQGGEIYNWTEMRSIFSLLFTAFAAKNRDRICRRASEYYGR